MRSASSVEGWKTTAPTGSRAVSSRTPSGSPVPGSRRTRPPSGAALPRPQPRTPPPTTLPPAPRRPGALRRGTVEVRSRGVAPLREERVVVADPDHPFTAGGIARLHPQPLDEIVHARERPDGRAVQVRGN